MHFVHPFSFINNWRIVMAKRRVAVFVGSDSDILEQCSAGLLVLRDEVLEGTIEDMGVYTMSVHWNHAELYELLHKQVMTQTIDVIIAGAGWAAHLPGMIDAILGKELRNTTIHVIGVAFEDKHNSRHTLAAELSISEVPKTRVIFADDHGSFIGMRGFRRACIFAATGDLPTLKLPTDAEFEKRESRRRTILEALEFIDQELQKRANALPDKAK